MITSHECNVGIDENGDLIWHGEPRGKDIAAGLKQAFRDADDEFWTAHYDLVAACRLGQKALRLDYPRIVAALARISLATTARHTAASARERALARIAEHNAALGYRPVRPHLRISHRLNVETEAGDVS